jgi:hypothetical protein
VLNASEPAKLGPRIAALAEPPDRLGGVDLVG